MIAAKGDVSCVDVKKSFSPLSPRTGIQRPPFLIGSEYNVLSCSEMMLVPRMAGSSLLSIALSSGCNNSPIPGMVLRK